MKIDANGNLQWQKTIGGAGNDTLNSLVVTDDGYLLAGTSTSNISGEKTDVSKGYADYWIVKIDLNGNLSWQKTIGGTDGDLCYRSVKTPDGYLLGGESYSPIGFDKSSNNRGSADFWIVNINESGNINWDKTFGGADRDVLYDLKNISDGYMVCGGSESGISGDRISANFGSRDGWVIRIDENGNSLWQKSIGGNDFDGFNQAVVLSDNSILLGGMCSSALNTGNITAPNYGGYDYWLIKLEPENLGSDTFKQKPYTIHPNPAKEKVTVQYKETKRSVAVTILNAAAQQLAVLQFTDAAEVTIPLDYAKGVYFLKMVADGEESVEKVVKE